MERSLSIILPARNEAASLPQLIGELRRTFPEAEIIVVDDGSTDGTEQAASQSGANRVIRHPYPIGNGAAIKDGARAARGETLLFLDADGQHRPEDGARIVAHLNDGYHMVVGARTPSGHSSGARRLANQFYNGLASWVTGRHIVDLTSGLRAVYRKEFLEFLFLLPNGFSYPTTSTMAFLRAGYAVRFVPADVRTRQNSKSHIRPLRDGTRFLLIIFKITTLYSPLKIFLPASAAFFLIGLGNYIYTYLTEHRFTNMSALLFIVSGLVFLMGLLAEQVANLLYANTGRE